MLNHLFADVVEEENANTKAAGGKKKGGGSMQTISATHRVSSSFFYVRKSIYRVVQKSRTKGKKLNIFIKV
jgi:hypothetical protein